MNHFKNNEIFFFRENFLFKNFFEWKWANLWTYPFRSSLNIFCKHSQQNILLKKILIKIRRHWRCKSVISTSVEDCFHALNITNEGRRNITLSLALQINHVQRSCAGFDLLLCHDTWFICDIQIYSPSYAMIIFFLEHGYDQGHARIIVSLNFSSTLKPNLSIDSFL